MGLVEAVMHCLVLMIHTQIMMEKDWFLQEVLMEIHIQSVLLSWNKVANRVAYLIKNDQFLQAEDYARMPEYEREQMANKILRFYDRLPEEIDRPFTDDFSGRNQEKK